MPQYKYKIRFIEYDGEYIDNHFHGSGGPLLVLLEYDSDSNSWDEVDQWWFSGEPLIQMIAWLEDSVCTSK